MDWIILSVHEPMPKAQDRVFAGDESWDNKAVSCPRKQMWPASQFWLEWVTLQVEKQRGRETSPSL